MVALLVGMGIMAILMTAAMPVWKTTAQREREAELIFRGQQYMRAIELYQRRLPGAMPPNLDVLIDQKFLRKKYKDPITGDDFDLIGPNTPAAGSGLQPPPGRGGAPQTGTGRGPGPMPAPAPAPVGRGGRGPAGPQGGTIGAQSGIAGVASKSKATSLRIYNGRSHYNEWQFVYVPRAAAPGAGAPGTGAPGQRGGPGANQPGIGPGMRGFEPGEGGRGRGNGRGAPPGPPGGRPGGSPFPPVGQPLPQRPQSPGN